MNEFDTTPRWVVLGALSQWPQVAQWMRSARVAEPWCAVVVEGDIWELAIMVLLPAPVWPGFCEWLATTGHRPVLQPGMKHEGWPMYLVNKTPQRARDDTAWRTVFHQMGRWR